MRDDKTRMRTKVERPRLKAAFRPQGKQALLYEAPLMFDETNHSPVVEMEWW